MQAVWCWCHYCFTKFDLTVWIFFLHFMSIFAWLQWCWCYHCCCCCTVGTKLTEYKVDEEAVASIAMEVGVAKREAEIVRSVSLPFNASIYFYLFRNSRLIAVKIQKNCHCIGEWCTGKQVGHLWMTSYFEFAVMVPYFYGTSWLSVE